MYGGWGIFLGCKVLYMIDIFFMIRENVVKVLVLCRMCGKGVWIR